MKTLKAWEKQNKNTAKDNSGGLVISHTLPTSTDLSVHRQQSSLRDIQNMVGLASQHII